MSGSEPTTSDDEVETIIAMLSSTDPRGRVLMLQAIAEAPTGSNRVVGRIEELVDDTEVTVLGLPYEIGEVRWAALGALAAERRAASDSRLAGPTDAVAPLSAESLVELAQRAGVPTGGGIDGLVRAYVALRERGLLATADPSS